MAAVGTPVINGVGNIFVGENFGESIGGAAMFPRAGAGDEVDVAGADVIVEPGIGNVGEVIDGIVEIEIVVVEAVHEIAEVVDAGHGEAAFENVGMFKERVGGVIGAEGSAHGGNGDAGLAVVPDEGDDFFAEVGIEDGLDVAAVEGMRGFVVEAEAVDGVNAEEFDTAGVDEFGEGADHGLVFEFPFVTGAGGKADERLAVVAVDEDAKFEAEAGRMPTMVFAFHGRAFRDEEKKYASGGAEGQMGVRRSC